MSNQLGIDFHHNSANTSLKVHNNDRFKNQRRGLKDIILEALAHNKDKEYSYRGVVHLVNRNRAIPISYKKLQPRISDLIKANKIHKTRNEILEGGIHVGTIKYGPALTPKLSHKDMLLEECKLRMTNEEWIIATREAERKFKYQKTQV